MADGLTRHVQVTSPSAATELAAILRLGMGIVIGSWLYAASAAEDDARRALLPYQAVITTRPAADVRVFQQLQEGLLEAEVVRSITGRWPEVDTLATDGIPPFADDPAAGAHACRWTRTAAATTVNYHGIPEHRGAPAWLIHITEPAPGEQPDQLKEDEEHHRLTDGTMIHVSTWLHAGPVSGNPTLVRVPQAEGWTQVYAVDPSP